MNITTIATLAASFLGGLGGLGALVTVRASRNKIVADAGVSDAKAADMLAHSAVALLAPTQAQIVFLTEALDAANHRITELVARIGELETKLDQANAALRMMPPGETTAY